jgi:hypothetical protein
VWPRCDANNSHLSGAEVKKERDYTFSPPKQLSWRVAGQVYFTYNYLLKIEAVENKTKTLKV